MVLSGRDGLPFATQVCKLAWVAIWKLMLIPGAAFVNVTEVRANWMPAIDKTERKAFHKLANRRATDARRAAASIVLTKIDLLKNAQIRIILMKPSAALAKSAVARSLPIRCYKHMEYIDGSPLA